MRESDPLSRSMGKALMPGALFLECLLCRGAIESSDELVTVAVGINAHSEVRSFHARCFQVHRATCLEASVQHSENKYFLSLLERI